MSKILYLAIVLWLAAAVVLGVSAHELGQKVQSKGLKGIVNEIWNGKATP